MKTLVPHLILDQFAKGRYQGQFQAATASIDISGFTPLTETLFRHRQDGAEILGETLGSIFGPLVSAVYREGGLIPLYAGDAFTAIFPATVANGNQESRNDVHRAWKTANAAQRYLMPGGKPRQLQTAYGTFGVSVKVGVGSGEIRWGIVGEEGLRTYYFHGPAISASTLAQLKANPGQIVVDENIQSLIEGRPAAPQIGTAAPPFLEQAPGDKLAVYLSDFIPQDILTLPIQAEFRHVCPVFISVKAPIETAVLEQFILDVLRQTRHHGGYFSQVEFGDKGVVLLLYFGAPISYENNVIRAVRCLSKLAEHRQQSKQVHPTWRAGLTYGLVWAGFRGGPERREYGVIGDVVNSAARISQEADWGDIWLDEQAAEQIAGEFECRFIGNRFLKGRQTAKTLYQLVGPQTKINITYQGQMIGRRKELNLLKQAVDPIFEGHFAGACYVYGEAGMGKSRLLFELQQELGDSVKWLYCPADEVLRQSLNPFRYYLQDEFQNPDEPSGKGLNREQFVRGIDQVITRLKASRDERAADIAAELERTQSCLAALLNIYWPNSLYEQLEPRLRYDNTLIAITTFVQAQSLFQPIILQLEDFHWFDLDSRQLLEIMSHNLAGYPAALTLASRFAADGSRPTFPVSTAVPKTIIQLETLDRSGVRALAEQLLDGPIHSDLLGFLEEKSGGRPFFAEQLLLELRDQEAIEDKSGQYVLRPKKVETIPTTLNTLLISRLDNLPLPVKQVVQTAAVLGERFLIPILNAILTKEMLPDVLQMGIQQRIWVLQDELRYVFKHALLRDAAYKMQPQSRRRELHRMAAEKLEVLYGGQPAPYFGEIAHHYEKAYLQGLDEVRETAVYYLTLAAERAIDNYENDTAVEYVNRALAILPEQAYEKRYDLFLLREKVHNIQAAMDPWRTDIEALSALVGWHMIDMGPLSIPPPLPDPGRQAQVALLSVRYSYQKGNYQEAEWYAQQGQALYREAGDLLGEAKCLALQGGMLWELGRYDKVPGCLIPAIDIFRRVNKPGHIAGCLNTLGITAADQGKYMEARGYYDEAFLLVENRDIGDTVMTLSNLGEVTCWLGLFDQAQQYTEQALRLARQIGHRNRQTMLLLNLSIMTLERGDWQLGQFYLKRCLEICRETSNRREEGTALHFLGNAAVLEGELGTAEAYFQEALEIRRQLGQRQFATEDRAALAWVAHQQKRPEQAAHYLLKVTTYLAENPAMFGAYKPLNVYWRVYQIARELDGRLAKALLSTAQQIIQERAADIPDSNIREAYLTNVPENQALLNV